MDKARIMIVEDEPALREVLAEALDHVGYSTQTVPDGRSLMQRLESDLPDLILLDIGLPDVSGWELQKQLQNDARYNKVPVIAVTGYGGAHVEQSAIKTLHFADYIRKPYSLADLMNRIEVVLEKKPQKQAMH